MNDKEKKEKLKKIIAAGVEQTGRLPKVADIAAEMNLRIYPTQKLIKSLADDGFLRRTGNNWYELNDGTPRITLPLVFSKPQKAAAGKEAENKQLAISIIKWSMLLVGIGSAIISAYYNVLLALDFLPPVLAVIAGCVFVVFSIIDFETILLISTFKTMHTLKRYGAMAGLALIWLVAVTFSITSVVDGRYEKYMSIQRSKSDSNMTVNAERLKWQNLQERKASVIRLMEERRGQLTKAEIVNDRKLAEYNRNLNQIRNQELAAINKAPEATDANLTAGSYTDFYAWLSKVIGAPKDKIQFFISILPAFFFDIFAPISIAIFMFLKKKP